MKRSWKSILLTVLKYTLAIIAGITCAIATIYFLFESDVLEFNLIFGGSENLELIPFLLLLWPIALVLIFTKKNTPRRVGIILAVLLIAVPVIMAVTEQTKQRIDKAQDEREWKIRTEQTKRWQSEATQVVREAFGEGTIRFGGGGSPQSCNLMMVRIIQGNKWAIYDYDVEQKRIVRTLDETKFRSLVVPHLPQGLEMWEISFTDNLDWINFNYRDGDKFYKGRVFVRDGCNLNLYDLIFLEDKSRKTIEIDVNVE